MTKTCPWGRPRQTRLGHVHVHDYRQGTFLLYWNDERIVVFLKRIGSFLSISYKVTHFCASQPTSTIVRRLHVNPTARDWLRLSWTCPWLSKICPSCEWPIISRACTRKCLASVFGQGSTCTQHASCKCPTLTGSSAKTTTPLFFVWQGFDDKRKKSTLIYSRFTIRWPRPRVDQVGLRRPVPAPFFSVAQSRGWPWPHSNVWRL